MRFDPPACQHGRDTGFFKLQAHYGVLRTDCVSMDLTREDFRRRCEARYVVVTNNLGFRLTLTQCRADLLHMYGVGMYVAVPYLYRPIYIHTACTP